MERKMKRKRRRHTPEPDSDSQALRGAVLSIVTGMGHGGLTWFAKQLRITPSNLKKRLTKSIEAFDGPTMRACLLLTELKAKSEHEGITGQIVGNYEIIETGQNGSRMPFWRAIAPAPPRAPTPPQPTPAPAAHQPDL